MEAVFMGLMKGNGMCSDKDDCIATGLAFLFILVEWSALLYWVMWGQL